MPLADLSTLDIVWIALSVFLVVVGLGLALVLFNLSGTVRRLTSFIQGLEKEVLPVINKAGGTVDRVNAQLDKVDRVTDSAVDATMSQNITVIWRRSAGRGSLIGSRYASGSARSATPK